jgi:hypothetical protein
VEGPSDYLQRVASVVDALRDLDLDPVLVGGMALVVLGSRRVTRDFDFVVARPGDERTALVVDVLYDQGLELVSKLDAAGNVVSTIHNRKVAAIRLKLDAPVSAYFFDVATGLRIDLLFDFPFAASELALRATRLKVQSHELAVASEDDLLRLKHKAAEARTVAGDADDIAFLESRRRQAGP